MKIKTDNYEIYKGDCLEVMDKLIEQGVKVDAIITDPPYGTTVCKWDSVIPFDEMWVRLNKLIKPNGAIVLFGCEPFSSKLRCSNLKDYKYDWKWDKVVGSNFVNAKRMPLKIYEDVCVFYEKQPTYNPQMTERDKDKKRTRGNSRLKENQINSITQIKISKHDDCNLKYPVNKLLYNRLEKELNSKYVLHPTQKPVSLLMYLVRTYTNENEVILDFTMGSGSTGVACMITDRKFIGIELDEKYFEIAENRLKEATEKKEELLKVFDKSN